MKKRVYYAVATTVFDDGRVIVRLAGQTYEWVRPANKFNTTPRADRYIDWFDSMAAAEQFIAENTKNV